jgi:hypothetical protein
VRDLIGLIDARIEQLKEQGARAEHRVSEAAVEPVPRRPRRHRRPRKADTEV